MRFPFPKRRAPRSGPEPASAPLAAPSPPRERPPGPLRVVAITRVLDEADVVEAFVRHTAAFVDRHLVVDNGSRDGTLDILAALAAEGLPLSVYATASASFCEATTNTVLYAEACAAAATDTAASGPAPDWVIVLDCDEFIDDRDAEGGFAAALERVLRDEPALPVVDLPLVEYEMSADDDAAEAVLPLRLRRRAHGPVTTKVCVRGGLRHPGLVVDGGNHAVLVDDRPLPSRPVAGLRLAHFPRRSRQQMAAKIAKGYAKVIAAGPAMVARNTALHYRSSYELLVRSPRAFFAQPSIAGPGGTDLVLDPIAYRGGPLRHTAPEDPDRLLATLLGYVNDLAAQHGRLMDEVPEARARVERWNGAIRKLY